MKKGGFDIIVPASTANIGPGIDSIGMAVSLFLTISCQPHDDWEFVPVTHNVASIPSDKENIIYQSALYVAKQYHYHELPAHRVEVKSEIPVARGLGSSGTAIAAGVELANQILNLGLTPYEKAVYATEIEGHPDNVAPSILGGYIVGHVVNDEFIYVQKEDFEDIRFVAVVPAFELATKTAREVLPQSLPYKESVRASAVANVSVAALFQGDFSTFGRLIEHDLFHQPYRKHFIPYFDDIVKYMKEQGAYGTYLSGAGPTLISICPKEVSEQNMETWKHDHPDFDWLELSVAPCGIKINSW
ncbi:homoserine kinase [Salirhabdus salicampi]|uniref:homoserine kinase n=1 Tax=Salirhabdus salicampi TaxID=476102 RepID=UPI0020C4AC6F|nr:homoserine kinase [Salirhabdus salicampi]MCP8617759.1 homoserine kinase [Salirhabdus salicampi]